MRLRIKNISSIKNIVNQFGISVTDVVVQSTDYSIGFTNPNYYGKWRLAINRIKENPNDSYDFELINFDGSSGDWERYSVSANQIADAYLFFHQLNEMCHDYDIINNK